MLDNDKDLTVNRFTQEALAKRLKYASGTGHLRKKSKIINLSEREVEQFRLGLEHPEEKDSQKWMKAADGYQTSFVQSGQMSFGIRKTRRSQDKYNGLDQTDVKEQQTPLKINSQRQYGTVKQARLPQKQRSSVRFHLDLPLSECATIQKENFEDKTLLLVNQNQKLARRVGQLQTQCQNMSHKLGFFKAKYEQDIEKLSKEKEKEMKQTIYLQKLVYYYKSLARKMNKKLIDYGIQDDTLTSTSILDTEGVQEDGML